LKPRRLSGTKKLRQARRLSYAMKLSHDKKGFYAALMPEYHIQQ